MSDPCAVVWDALEQAGCEPSGAPHKFRARCPAHDGDSKTTLAGGVGRDDQALLYCHKGCPVERVVGALGLGVLDLYALDRRREQPHPALSVHRSWRTVDVILRACRELGIGYRGTRNASMWLIEPCPACRLAPLIVHEDNDKRARPGRVALWCLGGCDPAVILHALLGVK